MKKIGVIIGSLRKAAFSRMIANYLVANSPEDLQLEIVEIGNLPLYNQDFDDHKELPESYPTFREKIAELDGFIFVTPEYNRSIPAVLKNAIDVASRPYGQNHWQGKPSAVISSSPGSMGGYGANQVLRQSMVSLDVPMLQQPEMYLFGISKSFDADGNLASEALGNLLLKFLDAYEGFAEKF